MSYDLRVWCVDAPTPEALATVAKGKGWLVNVASSACLAEDIPDEVIGKLPGIGHLVEINLSPIDAPQVGNKAAWKIARSIAKAARGVIEDPQQGTVELPSSIKRYSPVKREPKERVALLEMSWWLERNPLAAAGGIDRFLDALERWLPEAMPRRYGEYEPPQHELAKTGRAHLVEFLSTRLTGIVWYAHRPVVFVSHRMLETSGWSPHAGKPTFRCSYVSIKVDAAALEQPGWQDGLQRAWRALSHELKPFYGDVRTTHGHIGRSFMCNSDTEQHPVRSCFWRGLPDRLGHAAVFGEPYRSLWLELAERTKLDEGLAFVTTPDWQSGHDVADMVGGVPSPLAQSPRSSKGFFQSEANYAPVFPFKRP